MAPLPKDEQKRERILLAAIKIFALTGLDKGTIASIAKEAGIGKGTVYEYFSSKEEIFIAIFDMFFAEMMPGIQELVDSPLTPIQKLTTFFEMSFDIFQDFDTDEHSESWPVMLEIFTHGLRDEVMKTYKLNLGFTIRKLYKLMTPILEEGIKEGIFIDIEPEYLSFLLFASLDGLAIHYFLQRDHFDLEKMKKSAVNVMLNGVLK